MTHEQKITYMKIAAGICGFGFHTKDLDLLVSLYDLVVEKEGDTDLASVAKVQVEVKNRDDERKRSELLDKESKNVTS